MNASTSIPAYSQSASFRPFRFLLWSALALGALHAASQHMADLPLAGVILCLLALAVPMTVRLAYLAVLRKTERSQTLQAGGLLMRLAQGRMLSLLLCTVAGLALAVCLFVQVLGAAPADWALMALAPCIACLAYPAALRWVRRESVDWLCIRRAGWSIAAVSIGIALLRLALVYAGCYPLEGYATMADALDAQPRVMARTELATLGYWFAGFGNAASGFLLGIAPDWEASKLALTLAFSSVGFGGLLTLLLALATPAAEYRRILLPECIPSMELPRIPFGRVVLGSFLGFIMAGLAASALIMTESRLQAQGQEVRRALESRVRQVAVSIDGVLYDGDIMEASARLDARFLPLWSDARARMLRSASAMRATMTANVDGFLDWYYSLPAEYERIATLLMSQSAEELVQRRLDECLARNVDTAAYERAVKDMADVLRDWRQASEALLAQYRLEGTEPAHAKITVLSRERFFDASRRCETVTLNGRIGVSTGAAGIAGAIAGKFMAKTGGKVAAKALASVVAKLATKTGLSFLGGLAAGTATGVALGSVIPGAGTMIGAGIGLAATIVTWVATDEVLLKLDEAVNRDDLRRDILEELNRAFDSAS